VAPVFKVCSRVHRPRAGVVAPAPALPLEATGGFDDLRSGAIRFDVFGVKILASDLSDIIRSKEAADRPQDRQDVIVLREILRRRETGE